MANKFSSRIVVVGLVFSIHGHQVFISEQAQALANEGSSVSNSVFTEPVNQNLGHFAGEMCMADSLNSGCSVTFTEPGSSAGLFPSFQQECVAVDEQVSGIIVTFTRCFGI